MKLRSFPPLFMIGFLLLPGKSRGPWRLSPFRAQGARQPSRAFQCLSPEIASRCGSRMKLRSFLGFLMLWTCRSLGIPNPVRAGPATPVVESGPNAHRE